jgi:GNAT superfamily N-acetyltransferase
MHSPWLPEIFGLRLQEAGSGQTCRLILAALPQWFGIPEANERYVALAERSPTVVASVGDVDVGFATVVIHNPSAAEVAVMAVLPARHRQGIGTAMLRLVEQTLAHGGVEFLQVKTLGPSRPDQGYERTRAFYLAYGFRPLEELPDLWDAENPALVMVKVVDPR